MLRKNHLIDATQGSIIGKIFLYTYPLMLSMLVQTLFNAVDIIVLGNFADNNAVASVGATTTIVHLVVHTFVGLASGTKIILARQYGARDGDAIRKMTDTSLISSVIIGAFVAIMRLSKSKILNGIAAVYTEVIRDTPLLLQLYFFYFLLPDILPALKLSKFTCIAVALIINSGAYMSEIFRSGIQSIDRGQTEAARSLGLSASQTMLRIILPQAFKNVLPAMCNEFVAITKETSLASTFYVGDLMTQYQTISGKTYLVLEPLIIIGVIYFVLTFTMSKLVAVLEKKLKEGD